VVPLGRSLEWASDAHKSIKALDFGVEKGNSTRPVAYVMLNKHVVYHLSMNIITNEPPSSKLKYKFETLWQPGATVAWCKL
jgi:hypothetical protein